jgi:hypothetical protein
MADNKTEVPIHLLTRIHICIFLFKTAGQLKNIRSGLTATGVLKVTSVVKKSPRTWRLRAKSNPMEMEEL